VPSEVHCNSRLYDIVYTLIVLGRECKRDLRNSLGVPYWKALIVDLFSDVLESTDDPAIELVGCVKDLEV